MTIRAPAYVVIGGDTWASIAAALLGNRTLAESLARQNGYNPVNGPPVGATIYITTDEFLGLLPMPASRIGEVVYDPTTDTVRLRGSDASWQQLTVSGDLELVKIAEILPIAAPQASFDFQNIPQTYRHLLIRANMRGSGGAGNQDLLLRFNNDAAGNYDDQRVLGAAAVASADELAGAAQARVGFIPDNGAAAGRTGVVEILIPDYRNAALSKIASSRCAMSFGIGAGAQKALVYTALWRTLAAVNRITFYVGGGSTCGIGSMASLYGLR